MLDAEHAMCPGPQTIKKSSLLVKTCPFQLLVRGGCLELSALVTLVCAKRGMERGASQHESLLLVDAERHLDGERSVTRHTRKRNGAHGHGEGGG